MKVFLDRLRNGETEILDASIPPDLLEVNEKDLFFVDPIKVTGKAYISEDHLILQFSANTSASIPCIICNKIFKLPLAVTNVSYTEDVSNLRNPEFDLGKIVKETLLLELPLFAECSDGLCPEREELSKYLRAKNDAQYPFANFEISK